MTALAVSALSLSWDSTPYSEHQLEGSSSQRSHPLARCVFRVRTSLDALIPFEPPGHFWSGRSWDSTFRAFLLPEIRGSFETLEPSWRYPSRRTHASSTTRRTQSSSWFMTPREAPGRPPSGPSTLREAVPLSHRFKFAQRPLPSWFSSSLGYSPPWSAGWPSPPAPLTCFRLASSLSGPRQTGTPAYFQTWRRYSLSREHQPFRGSSLGSTHLFEASDERGY